MKNRLLSMLLALCLLTSICATALAESPEASAGAVEEASTEAEGIELPADPDGEAGDAEPASNGVEEEAPSSDAAPALSEGYAAVIAENAILYDDAYNLIAENLPLGTVVYVRETTADGQARVACGIDGSVALLWTDAVALRPLEADEVSAYIESAKADPDALWLDDATPLSPLTRSEVAPEAPAALALDESEITLEVGQSQELHVSGAVDGVEWSVADASVATVSEDGVLTGVAAGETEVIATAGDGETSACAVTVSKAAKAYSFVVQELTLGVKETSEALKILFDEDGAPYTGAVTYRSDNKKIASVTAAGVVKGVKKGTTCITATTADNRTATCTVNVLKAPSKVYVKPEKLTLGEGQSYFLEYSLPSGTAGAVTWSVKENKKGTFAAVDPITGEVTALAAGSAEIYAKAFNGKKGTVKLTVLPAPKALAFMKDPMAIGVGQKARAAVTDTGTAGQIEYEIDDESILSITNDVMTGLAVGSTHVTAMTYNGLTAECDVTVNPAPEYVKLPNANGLILGVNETCQLTPDSGGRTDQYAYSSSKAKYVKVSETGEIKALKAGTAVITVKTYNNLSCSLTVTVMKAPTSVTASPRSHNMGVGDQFTLGYTFPKKTGGSVRFESSDPGILLVDSETGLVKAVGAGEADVKVTTYNKHSDVCHVKVFKAPTSITLASDLIELAAGEVFDLSPVLSEGSWSEITYESKDPSVARVSGDGKVTGVAYGTTEIVASTSEPSVYAIAFVQVWDAPSSVKLSETSKTLNVDDVYQINPIIPDGSRTTFTYDSGNKKVAVVDDGGVVHALARGSAVITVSTHNNKQAVLKLQVLDPYMPDSITLTEEPPSLKEGATYQVKYKVLPATADAKLLWFSSDESVATVSDSGLVKAVGTGYATITAVSQKDESLSISVSIAVGTDKLTLVIPARTTDEKGIKANLAKIDAIRKSAIYEIDRLASKGVISSSDATKRRAMVNNIFKNYAFPWKTLKLQKYWKAANSEGGVKDFKTDRVYYGLPYISGSGDNRHYDVALALKENRYYDSDKGYYILNQNKLLGGKYVGNDCSGLVNVSIWGTSSSRASDRTSDIASSKYYRTISDWSSMRPGDLICKGNAHVVMFLYYTNAEKTKIMMIENGGAEPGTNTVHCDIYNLSYYQDGKYKVRRLSTLG